MKRSSAGFTLLEVIIAITILAFISVFTAQSIQRGLRSKAKIELDIERSTQVRDALRVVGADVRKAFKYEDIHIALFNIAQKERKKRYETKSKSTDPNKKKDDEERDKDGEGEKKAPAETDPNKEKSQNDEQKPPKEFPLKEVQVVTRFLGESDKINFTSLSNRRAYVDARNSNQAEVGYYLEDCKSRLNKKKTSKCLWRRISHIIDEEIEEGGKASVLVENVTDFGLRYLAKSEDEEPKWLEKWDSNDKGNEDTGNRFPEAVEITLGIHDKENKKDKPIKMTYVAPLRFPEGIQVPTQEAATEEKKAGETGETGESGELEN